MSRTIRVAVGVSYVRDPGSRISKIGRRLLAVALLVVVLTSIAPGQTTVKIEGHIFDDSDGLPIIGARVGLVDTDYHTITDFSGYFQFNHIPIGHYRLKVEAEGYEASVDYDIDVVTDVIRRWNARLTRRIYDLGVTEVKRQMATDLVAERSVIARAEIDRSGADNLARVLESVEGVHISEAGPAGGPVRVSIRGCDPKHVLVLLDGQRVNAASGGEADLETIPLEMVEKIEVYRGGQSARFGSGALGGVVNIITQIQSGGANREVKTTKYWGKWKNNRYNLTFINPVSYNRLTGRFNYSAQSTISDYYYEYPHSTKSFDTTHIGTRANAGFDRYNYHGSGSYILGSKTFLGFSGQAYRARKGLPGEVLDPNSSAWSEDKRILGHLNLKHSPSSRYKLDLNAGFSRFEQYFYNHEPQRPNKWHDSRYINDILTLKSTSLYQAWASGELRAGLDFERNVLYHDDFQRPDWAMGRNVRDNMGLSVGLNQNIDLDQMPLVDVAAIDLSIRWDRTVNENIRDTLFTNDPTRISRTRIDNYRFLSKAVSLSVSRSSPLSVAVRGGYGTSYNLPSVNALFWKGDVQTEGNPDLRPEKSEHSDIGIEITTDNPVKLSAGISYFHSYVRDLIVWQQAANGWKPKNNYGALITGHEDFVNLGLFEDIIQLRYNNTITVSKNKDPGPNLYNKYLTYRPHYVTNLECILEWRYFRGAYRVRLVDMRFNRAANSKWYPAYRIDDLNLRFSADFNGLELKMTYLVNNLRSDYYVLVPHYPMPGREWGIDISLSYKMN